MEKHWFYFTFMLLLCYITISSILMFLQGFLLSRKTFTYVSSCTVQENILCNSTATSITSNEENINENHCYLQEKMFLATDELDNASSICFPKRAKVILLVIDALRYDFTTYNKSVETPLPFQNKLKIIHELLQNKPNNAKLFKFIADPPTTTMQRLKGLTTGSLPTFIDAGSNFATPEINEDNLIDQLVRHNRKIVFMGDDTWTSLYPNRFHRSWPFPSFNVWDLDTVDNGITSHIYSEINKSDWHLIIGHFLGVDHCGHRYGPLHEEMERKLTEMNDVIENVTKMIDDETVVFVIGDHGMTNTGDHGGDTEQEVSAAMFVYSSKPLLNMNPKKEASVNQIDIVPTLSTILGVPIPFSNLGSIIFDAIPFFNITQTSVTNTQLSLFALWSNIQQTLSYIKMYSSTNNEFNADKLNEINEKYFKLSNRVKNVQNESQLESFVLEAQEYLKLIRIMCEEVWIQFDSLAISRGLILMFLTIFFVYTLITGVPNQYFPKIFSSFFILYSYLTIFAAALIILIFSALNIIENFKLTLFFFTGVISVFMFTFLIIQHWEIISINWYECSKKHYIVDLMCRVILLIMLCALFSNSYVLEEARVLSFLLLTYMFVVIYSIGEDRTLQTKNKQDKFSYIKLKLNGVKLKLIVMGLLIGLLMRLSMYYWRCREEQKWCFQAMNEEIIKVENNSEKIKCVVSLICLALFITLTRIWLRSCGNLIGFSPLVTVTRYAPTVIVVCLGGFWILNRFPKENIKLAAKWNIDILAWNIYGLVILVLLIVIIQPMAVYILPQKKESVPVHSNENIIPQLFKHVKGLYRDTHTSSNDAKSTPIVYGLGTVYSAPFITLSIVIVLLLALLLEDVLATSTVIMYFTGAIVLTILSIAHYEKSSSVSQLFDVPTSSVLCWVLLSLYFFYGTSHQPSFSAIHWNSAFIGTGGTFANNIIPAILIGINTFGSYIFFGLTTPLLVIAPFTLYVMFPSLGSVQSFKNKDMRRGELLLYENDEYLFKSVFTLGCKYVLCHGIRVFTCMLSATIHCRHLMVWSIFAPKLIFEVFGFIISLIATLLSYLLLIRINHSVNKLIMSLEQYNR